MCWFFYFVVCGWFMLMEYLIDAGYQQKIRGAAEHDR